LHGLWSLLLLRRSSTLLFFFKIFLEEFQGCLIVVPSIKTEPRAYLEAEVSLVPREALLVATWVHLHVAIPIREPLRGDVSLQVLNVEDDVVTELDIDLVVFVHL